MIFKKHFLVGILIFYFISHSGLYGQNNRKTDSLIQVLKSASDDTNKVRLLNDIGGYIIANGEYDKSLDYLIKARDLAEKLDYNSGLCIAYNRTGILYLNKNDYALAGSNFAKALALAKLTDNKKSMADITSNIGIVFCDKGEYAKALENYMSALKIRESIKDMHGVYASMMSVANVYLLQDRYNDALGFYFNILKMEEIKKDKSLYSRTIYNIGLSYYQLKDNANALNYFNSALKLNEEIGDKQGVAIAYNGIATIYSLEKNYPKALELLQKGCDVLTEIGDRRSLAEAYSVIGSVYDSLKQGDKALLNFNKQLSIAKEIGSKLNVAKAYLHISNHYQLTGNFDKAYYFYKLHKTMEDSLKNEASFKAIAELETKYESQKKEKEIELLKTEQRLQLTENTRQKQLIFSCLVVAVVLALSGFLFYNRQQLKKKNALEKKNFELERNALSAQMNPHFIFNSLGSISGFISDNDKDKAIEYLGVFSRLIRHNLEQSREQLVSVVNEAQMLRSYLFLQQLRYNHKFNFVITIDEAIDKALAIPPMFIQPFVENAILHGILPKGDSGNIEVKFYTEKTNELICEVTDDGIGKAESLIRKTTSTITHKSLALTITEERMEIINSMNEEKIKIVSSDQLDANNIVIGTSVKLTFPLDYI